MKKRKMMFNLKILMVLAIVVACGMKLWVDYRNKAEMAKINEYAITAVEVPEEKDFILNIPLPEELQEELYEASEEFGVDYYTMIALIDRETKFRNVSGDGGDSYGYCQIQPQWWYDLMIEIGATDLTVPEDNFRVACAIMAQLTDEYNSIEGALVAYNQGYYDGSSTQYSREIIENAERYRA